jgi:hypothetical protein
MDAQPRVTDLIPKRIGTIVLLFLAGLSMIAALEALYAWMPALASRTTDGRVAAFDLDDEGSLGAWFSSLLLAASGLAALLVWSLRRHRLDDYHGRYRIWLWAAVCWLVMSIDEACSLHEGFKELMTMLTGQRLLGDGSLWWVMAYTLVLGGLGLRLLMEMRECRTSAAALLLAGCSWVVAVVAQLDWLLPRSGARGVMIEEGCEMLGDLLLLLAMSLHARHTIFDVQGKLSTGDAQRKRVRRKKATAETVPDTAEENASAPRRPKRTAAPAVPEPAEPRLPVKTAPTPTPVRTESPRPVPASEKRPAPQVNLRADAAQPPVPAPKLSKAERRAQRRRDREERDQRL